MWPLLACTEPEPRPPAPPPPEVDAEVSAEPGVGLARRFALSSDDDDAPLTLRCASADDPADRHVLRTTGSSELVLYGLLGDTAFDCAVTDDRGREVWTGGFRTDPLPADLPTFTTTGDPDRAALDDGFALFSHWRIGAGERVFRVVIADGAGRIRWWLDLPRALAGGVAATWTGDQLVVGGGGAPPALRDLSGVVSFQVGPPQVPDPDDDVYNHEAALCPAGLVSLQTVPDTDGTITWRGFRIEVTDPASGAVVWSADSRDARAAGVLPPGTPEDDDPYHANAVAWRDDDPEGPSVWVSLRGLRQLVRIDRDTGAWRLVGDLGDVALVDPQGRALPWYQWWQGQHAPEYRGADVLVYDNGVSRPGRPKQTRIARYTFADPDTATLAWTWTEDGWFEPNFGSVMTLPSGHVVIGNGHSADSAGTGGQRAEGWIAEVDPDAGDVVWRMRFGHWSDTLYRAQALDGCAIFADARACPALDAP